MKGWSSAVLAALVLAACQPGKAGQERAGEEAGAQAGSDTAAVAVSSAEYPALQVTTLDGKALDLASLRGQWVVVNFWATWCSPCLKEMPELSDLHARRQDVTVIGLAYEETDVPTLSAFLAGRPVAYPVAIADPFDPPAGFATPRGLPMTFLIDPDGRLQEQYMGPVTAGQLEAAIAAAKAG